MSLDYTKLSADTSDKLFPQEKAKYKYKDLVGYHSNFKYRKCIPRKDIGQKCMSCKHIFKTEDTIAIQGISNQRYHKDCFKVIFDTFIIKGELKPNDL